MSSSSLGLRAVLALILMIGFYGLAIAVALGLLYVPYAEWTYANRIHVRVAIFCVAGAGIIIWSIIPRRSRFTPPGPRITPEKQPRFFSEISNIAKEMGQQMPAEVYVDYNVNAWVVERGGLFGIGSKRVLCIGLPLLKLLTVSQFKAVLAHEFGHFYGGDTRLGPWVYKTRSAISRTLQALSVHGSVLQLPFLLYGKLFMRVTNAVSRAQEYSADKIAAKIAGSSNMIDALKMVYGNGQAFELYWDNELIPILNSGYYPPILDGFEMFINSKSIVNAVDIYLDEEIKSAKPNPYDTHPPLRDRILSLKSIPDTNISLDNSSAISLFINVLRLENKVLFSMGGKDLSKKLLPVSWEAVDRVYIPLWREHYKKYLPALNGITAKSLPELSKNISRYVHQLNQVINQRFDKETALYFTNHTVGVALSLQLVKKGFTVKIIPGESIKLVKDEITLEPFDIIINLLDDKLSSDDWFRLSKLSDIEDLRLDKVQI